MFPDFSQLSVTHVACLIGSRGTALVILLILTAKGEKTVICLSRFVVDVSWHSQLTKHEFKLTG
jgi:hypothetical protein